MSVDRPALEFVDTNILIYAFDVSAGAKRERARALVETLWQERRGALSVQVLQEFYVTLTRKLAQPLSPEQARPLVADFTAWKVYCPTPEDVLAAIDLQHTHKVSFWDAMILRGAQALDCAKVWSEDLTDQAVYAGVEVSNPFAR